MRCENKPGFTKHYYFIGIGGIGMSAIARLFLNSNIKVSGSDLKESKIIDELKNLGAQIFIGHNPGNIKGADLIVYSSAVRDDNPEIVEAKKLKIPLMKRAQALAELMQDKIVITVTGSHGKTTTTSLASCLLLSAGLSPSVAIGGVLKNIDTNACFGKGDFFVAEADESDGSFLFYQPKYSIITNIDYEHLDYYKEFQNELVAFRDFLRQTREGGCIFGCDDDVNLKAILKDCSVRYQTFGLTDSADIFAKNIYLDGLKSEFDCFCKNKFVGRFNLALAGTHNISNALSVIALGLEIGIDLRHIKNALLNYKGACRRLDVKLDALGYLVIDDYAHHPTELKATLLAVKNLKAKRVIAVFQPHRFSRTKLLLDEFGRSFDNADYIIVTDIYAAGEPAICGISGMSIYEKIKDYAPDKEVIFMHKDQTLAHLLKIMKSGDLVLFLGAGDIVKVSDELAGEIKRKG
ncbi:MAG: UDP-N-acetylmuramate--L-alanine ligase [Candidatus Omnitrophota bacterium]|nr:UDP-N-acetylmuramate--L-alanine ligase [Candidatus Omnitrophota bacterium]